MDPTCDYWLAVVVQTLTTVTLVKQVICKEKLIKGDKYILIRWYQYKGLSAAGGRKYTEYDGQVVCIADLGCIVPYVLKRGKGHSCPSLHSNTLTFTSTPYLGNTAKAHVVSKSDHANLLVRLCLIADQVELESDDGDP